MIEQPATVRSHVEQPVACALDLPVVRAAGVIPLIRPLRPLRLLLAPELDHAHIDVREVPKASVEVDRQPFDRLFASLRVPEDRIGMFLAAEKNDHRAVVGDPRGLDRSPVDVLDLLGLDDVADSALRRPKLHELVVAGILIQHDPDHRRLAVLVRHHDQTFRVPRQRRDLRADTEVVVNAADLVGTRAEG